MYDILFAKFTQIPICKQVLLLTQNAILLHGSRGIPICQQFNLEKIRNELKNNKIFNSFYCNTIDKFNNLVIF